VKGNWHSTKDYVGWANYAKETLWKLVVSIHNSYKMSFGKGWFKLSLSFIAKNIKAKSLKATESNSSSRLPFLDRTRGLIMIFMALDHALFFWSTGRINNEGLPFLVNGAVTFNPLGVSSALALIVIFVESLCTGFSLYRWLCDSLVH